MSSIVINIATVSCCIISKFNNSFNIEDITRWPGDMNFIFSWQDNILRTSVASEQNIVFATRN